MKRTICLILALICVGSFASCARNKTNVTERTLPETHAYDPATDGEVGGLCVIFHGDGEDTAGHDLSVWRRDIISDHKEEDAPKTASIELMGKTFEGKYFSSAVFYPATHLSHYYRWEYGGFAVNAETGEIDSFNATYAETEETLTLEQCQKRADAVAETFIDLDEYQVDYYEDKATTFFTYTKYVEGLPTNDMFSVGISIYGGGISVLGASLVGSFEVTEETESAVRRLKEALDEADEVLKEKISGRYTSEFNMYREDYSVICLPDGTVALKTKVEATVQKVDDFDGETYYYPATSAYDAYIFERDSAK